MHNMNIESEHVDPVVDEPPYDLHGSLAQVDHHVLAEFHALLPMHGEI
jgi:hypothetical protein